MSKRFGKLLDLNDKLRNKELEAKGEKVAEFFTNNEFLLTGFNMVNDIRDFSFYGFLPDIIDECEKFSDKENKSLLADSFIYALIYRNLLSSLKVFIDINVEAVLRNCDLNKDSIDEYIKILERNINKEKIEENKILLEQVRNLKNVMNIYDTMLNSIS